MNPINIYYRIFQQFFRPISALLQWREPQLLIGEDAISKLPEAIKAQGLERVFVVVDKTLEDLGLAKELYKSLENGGIAYEIYNKTQPNPTIDNVELGRQLYIKSKAQWLIAFGGGSQIDCAKGIRLRIAWPGKTIQQLKSSVRNNLHGLFFPHKLKIVPLFAIPTTAGSGSEGTVAAVISDARTHEKYPVNDVRFIPEWAVLEPSITAGLPPAITASTGLDALTHAVEAFIGQANTKATKEHAKKSVKLVFENLYTAYNDGKNLTARENMLLASYYGGLAFTRAFVGYSHAIAHVLGGLYGTPHGLANAVILPHVLEWYGKSVHKSLAILADEAGIDAGLSTNAEKAQAFIQAIKKLCHDMEIPEKLDMVQQEDIPRIVKTALKEANPLYPVPKIMHKRSCEAFLRSIIVSQSSVEEKTRTAVGV
ncbi:MAG: iron-containing alcohol dehydrogenase [Oscillospiraceae bacterium]|nr:iron-containing alcohol dehydrogenase [Oscillospiraceae bacterium]